MPVFTNIFGAFIRSDRKTEQYLPVRSSVHWKVHIGFYVCVFEKQKNMKDRKRQEKSKACPRYYAEVL
jgi:hypothetical protein